MPRQPRLDYPGAIHHVMVRGIDGRDIFLDESGRNDFVERAGALFLATATACFAWALIPNHWHLILRTGLKPLWRVMLKLLSGFARTFNARHQRRGYVFQDRYKAILVEDDDYLDELVRYVHLNPIRAGIVEDVEALADYPWTGHAELLGNGPERLCSVEEVLARFGRTVAGARRNLSTWVEEGIASEGACAGTLEKLAERFAGHKPEANRRLTRFAPKQHTRVLGSNRFVEEILLQVEEQESRHLRLRNSAWSVNEVIEWTCTLLHADPKPIKAGRRSSIASRARAVICYLLVVEFGRTNREVALNLGVTPSAVTRSVVRGEQICSQEGITIPYTPTQG